MANDWKKYIVDDFADVIGGGTPSTSDSKNFGGDIPWITPKDLSNHRFRYIAHGERNITKQGQNNSNATLLPTGTVLLSSRAPVGYLAIASNPVTTNQGFKSLIAREGFHNEFIYYLLKANVEYLKSQASGTTFGELSGGTLKKLKFRIPSYSKQQDIANILGSLDNKIELNYRMNETLETMAQVIFRRWFLDNEDVEKWNVVTLPEIIWQICQHKVTVASNGLTVLLVLERSSSTAILCLLELHLA
jgi:type I restriction enzyme S subunit